MAFGPPSRVARTLRISASAAILLISALMLLLWMRNLWRSDVAWMPLPSGGHVVFASFQGQLEVGIRFPAAAAMRFGTSGRDSPPWGAESYSVTWNHLSEIFAPPVKPLRYRRLSGGSELNLMAPYWCLVPLSWLLAAAPWIRWSKRFSLRAFLIATTLIAGAMGVYVTSKW